MKILIYGLGHIGSAIAKGFSNEGSIEVFGHSRTNGLEKANNLGIKYLSNISNETISDFDYIFICTRNADQKAACQFFNQFEITATIVSVASGVLVEDIKKYFVNNQPKILRIMPNLFSNINQGTTLLDKSVATKDDEKLFQKIGSVYAIDEKLFSVGTILSGCSPAYLAYFLKAISDWGVENSLTNNDAREIISDLFIATGTFLKNNTIDIQSFIDSVCVPGGVTIEGIESFKKDAIDRKIKNGLSVSLTRDEKK
jgi:pyrroline-5-carboxylate reductase